MDNHLPFIKYLIGTRPGDVIVKKTACGFTTLKDNSNTVFLMYDNKITWY